MFPCEYKLSQSTSLLEKRKKKKTTILEDSFKQLKFIIMAYNFPSVMFERKKKCRCYICSIAMYSSETWTLRKLEQLYLESFKLGYWRRIEKIKWSEKVTNDEVFERIGEKRILLDDCLLRGAIDK